ncbi:MAG: hypothetical protein NWQ19_11835 [Nonlabens sp.]|nr:hypothetical protein [Nonlabens sp.]
MPGTAPESSYKNFIINDIRSLKKRTIAVRFFFGQRRPMARAAY